LIMYMQSWRYIEERNVSASYGLGVDEYLTEVQSKSFDLPISLRLYTYQNIAALSGRFQDLEAEIDIEFCNKNNIQYSRRLTGGGAIVMGEHQLGICLTAPASAFEWTHIKELYQLFSQPIINALQKLGINAEFKSRNDLEVNNRKIAGLGVYVSPAGNIQFHTSLLNDLDITRMLEVLKIPIQKYSDKKKISSVGERLTTIRKELNKQMSMEDLISQIKNSFKESFNCELLSQPIEEQEKEAVGKFENDRYLNDEWRLQNSPQADMTGMSLKKTPLGLIRTYIGLKGETIKSVLITGDFFEKNGILNQIEMSLKWKAFDLEKIRVTVYRVFEDNDPSELNPEDIIANIWRAGQRATLGERYTYNGSCYYPKSMEEKELEVEAQ
jgi:lipoate-protein ligase A